MTSFSARRFGSVLLLACTLGVPALTVSPPAAAQTAPATAKPTPEHIALARAVLDFTGARRSFDNVVPKLLQDARGMILRTRPTLEADLDTSVSAVATKLQAADDELVNSIATIYAQKFSEAELKEIAAFYQSPTGKKMTSELPAVLGESYRLIQDWSRKMSVSIMTELRTEMKKKGHDL